MATTIGHAQILISPELNNTGLKRFEAKFKAAMAGIARRNPINVQIDTKKYQAQLRAVTSKEAQQQVRADFDRKKYELQLRALTAKAAQQEVNLELKRVALYKARLEAATRPVTQTVNIDIDRRASAVFHSLRRRVQLLRESFTALRPVVLSVATTAVFLTTKLVELAGSLGRVASAGIVLPVALGAIVQAAIPVVLATSSISNSLVDYAKNLVDAGGASRQFGLFLRNNVIPPLQQFEERMRAALFPAFMEAFDNLSAHGETFGNVMEATAKKVGEFVVKLSEWATMERSLRDFTAIGEANVRIFEDLGNVAINLLDILRNLWTAAIPLTERFTNWLVRATTKLRDIVETAKDDGRLAAFFQRAGDAAAQWGRILANVAVGLFNVFKAITPLTDKTVDDLEKVTARFREWTGSVEGAEKIRNFFQFFHDLDWEKIFKGMLAVAGALSAINVARSAFSLVGVVAPLAALGPIGIAAGAALGAVAVGLTALVGGFALAYAENDTFRGKVNATAATISSTVGPVFSTLNETLKEVGENLTPVVDTITRFIEEFVQGFAPTLPGIIEQLKPFSESIAGVAEAFSNFNTEFEKVTGMGVAEFMGKAFGVQIQTSLMIMTVLIRSVAFSFQFMANQIQMLRIAWDFLSTLFGTWIPDLFSGFFDWLGREWSRFWRSTLGLGDGSWWKILINGLGFDWTRVWEIIKSIWNGFVSFFTNTFNTWRNTTIENWGRFLDAIGRAWDAVWRFLRQLWNSFIGFITGAWNAFFNFGSTLFQRIFSTVSSVWNSMWNTLKNLWNSFRGFIEGAWNAFRDFVVGLFDAIRQRVGSIWDQFWNRLTTLWNNFKNSIQAAWNAFKTFVIELFDNIRERIGSIWDQLWDRVWEIWTNIRDTIFQSINTFKDNIIELFEKAGDGIRETWNRIRDFAKAPIKFVIETVYNTAIGNLWRAARRIFTSMPEFPKATLPSGFASGGIYPGYTPGRDIGVAAVSGGEAIMRPEWTRAVGPQLVHEMNRVARHGGAAEVRRRFLGYFEDGGIVGMFDKHLHNSMREHGKFNENPFAGTASGPWTDWIPGPDDVASLAARGAEFVKGVLDKGRQAIGRLFFTNPIAGKLAKTLEKTIDNNISDKGWQAIPRRFVIGLYDSALSGIANLFGFAALGGAGGRDTGVGGSALLQAMVAFVRRTSPGVSVSSGYRPGDPGYHGRQRAIDMIFSDGSQNRGAGQAPGGQALRAANAIKAAFGRQTLELIWDPLGGSAVWNGRSHRFTGPSAGPGTHNDHVHWAFGGTLADLRSGGGGASAGQIPGAGGGSGGGLIGQVGAKFGALSKASGLWEKYKQQVLSADSAAGTAGLVNGDGNVMRTALRQAQAMNASNKVLLALFMAGFVESGFRNGPAVRFVDHDSAGFLQQRPSQGWGTLAQVENVAFATRSFVQRAMAIERSNPGIDAGVLAQSVQRSAFPARYGQMRGRAIAALRSLGVAGFDSGGVMAPGIPAMNYSGQPEYVFTGQQWAAITSLAKRGTEDRPIVIELGLDIDGAPLDAKIEAKQKENEENLVRVITARRRRR